MYFKEVIVIFEKIVDKFLAGIVVKLRHTDTFLGYN